MRAVIQRVNWANVSVDLEQISSIEKGLLILLGVDVLDDDQDILWLAKKIAQLRIFSDNNAMMNLSVKDMLAEVLVVSQFTLLAQVKKGNRPSFTKAALPKDAKNMYSKFVTELENILERKVKTGVFGADMKVSLCNDGPVTIFIDTKNKE